MSRDGTLHSGASGDSPSHGEEVRHPGFWLLRYLGMDRPIRKRPEHGVRIEVGMPTLVFVTVCTKDHVPWLAGSEVHTTLREVWSHSAAWQVGRYVLMPDYLHFFLLAV